MIGQVEINVEAAKVALLLPVEFVDLLFRKHLPASSVLYVRKLHEAPSGSRLRFLISDGASAPRVSQVEPFQKFTRIARQTFRSDFQVLRSQRPG